MNLFPPNHRTGVSRTDVLAILVMLALLFALAFAGLEHWRNKSIRLCCYSDLRHVGLSFQLWANDHDNSYPMMISTKGGGARESVAKDETFRVFQVMSNELSTPGLLICGSDTRNGAHNFGTEFGNSNISYFVGIDAQPQNPDMMLAGDRNLLVNGQPVHTGLNALNPADKVSWSRELHHNAGNVVLVDGSVHQVNSAGLARLVQQTTNTPIRLAIP